MNTTLPQVCITCRQLKLPELGRFIPVRSRFNKKIWKCNACTDRDAAKPFRQGRLRHRESPVEISVKQQLRETGYRFIQDYPMGPWFYDFAFPTLRLMLEIDGRSYHQTPRQRDRDAVKEQFARSRGWKLVRLTAGVKTDLEAERAVLLREREMD